MKAEEYRTEVLELNGVKVEIRSYKIEDTYYCHVSNIDAGATVARASSHDRDEAVQIATGKARQRLH